MKSFKIRNFDNHKIFFTSSIEELSNITGYDKSLFEELKNNDIAYLGHYRVECVNDKPVEYYKNLWKFEE